MRETFITFRSGLATKEFIVTPTNNGYVVNTIAYGSWTEETFGSLKQAFAHIRAFGYGGQCKLVVTRSN